MATITLSGVSLPSSMILIKLHDHKSLKKSRESSARRLQTEFFIDIIDAILVDVQPICGNGFCEFNEGSCLQDCPESSYLEISCQVRKTMS